MSLAGTGEALMPGYMNNFNTELVVFRPKVGDKICAGGFYRYGTGMFGSDYDG